MRREYKEAIQAETLYEAARKMKALRYEGVVWVGFKPSTGSPGFDPLPEGQYKFVVIAPNEWVVAKPEWLLEYDLKAWNEREDEKAADGKAARHLKSIDELPAHKKMQIQIPLVVREGEYKGRRLPTVYLGVNFNNDPRYMEKSNWYKFLRAIVPDIKKRAEANDLPDFDEEVVGFGATADVEVTDKGRNKIVGWIKDDMFGKRVDGAELLVLSGDAAEDDGGAKEGDSEIPF